MAVPEVKKLYEGDQSRLLKGSQPDMEIPATVQNAC